MVKVQEASSRELVSKECWCWLAESWRYTGYCMLLMVGTAAWHSHTAGAAGWHGLATAGPTSPLC